MVDKYRSDPLYREMITALIKADGVDEAIDLKVIPRKPRSWRHPMVASVTKKDAEILASALSHLELTKLIRSLVKYTRKYGPSVSGGSASPVVFLYQQFCDLYPEDEPEMTAWIVDNRINNYEPFGTIIHCDSRSMIEHLNARHQQSLCAQANIAESSQRHEDKLAREAVKATENLPNAIRRGDIAAINALLEKGADTQEANRIVGSLQKLAALHKRDKTLKLLIDKNIL